MPVKRKARRAYEFVSKDAEESRIGIRRVSTKSNFKMDLTYPSYVHTKLESAGLHMESDTVLKAKYGNAPTIERFVKLTGPFYVTMSGVVSQSERVERAVAYMYGNQWVAYEGDAQALLIQDIFEYDPNEGTYDLSHFFPKTHITMSGVATIRSDLQTVMDLVAYHDATRTITTIEKPEWIESLAEARAEAMVSWALSSAASSSSV